MFTPNNFNFSYSTRSYQTINVYTFELIMNKGLLPTSPSPSMIPPGLVHHFLNIWSSFLEKAMARISKNNLNLNIVLKTIVFKFQ